MYNNKGAIIKFKGQEINIQQFNYTAHPYILPNFMDVFSWSIPFVTEKVMEILFNILKKSDPEVVKEAEEDSGKTEEVDIQEKLREDAPKPKLEKRKIDILRSKVRTMSRMLKMFKTLREEREAITKLRGLCPDSKIPRGLLLEGGDAIKNAIDQFTKAKEMDKQNEAMPEFPEESKSGAD